MAKTTSGSNSIRSVEALKHNEAQRKNIPTAEYQSVMVKEEQSPIRVAYERRNQDLDPQLVWRGKDQQDWSDLVVQAPPLYIQEKVHPKALIDDLLRQSKEREHDGGGVTADLFSDFNGVPKGVDKTEFYKHDQNWSNRMILGDSLQVMASLAEREGLRGKVQCIYFDPPYGITFNSNFQWSTTSRDVKDGNADHITREPEQVKAFRDTWRDGIHSYLTYLRDRLTVARDLLSEAGSLFIQIGDENVHRVRVLMDEIFGDGNFVTEILVKKKGSQISDSLESVNDYILWYFKGDRDGFNAKVKQLLELRNDAELLEDFPIVQLESGERIRFGELETRDKANYRSDFRSFQARYPTAKLFGLHPLKSGGFRANQSHDFHFRGRVFPIKDGQCWKHTVVAGDGETTPGMNRLAMADMLYPLQRDVRFVRFASTPSARRISNWWDGVGGASKPIYVVQTNTELVKRCLLMATGPGDLVLDPTCGSGTTAFVAEQWGRRWITIDTSRVALALARARIMGAKFPFYLLADSREGQLREAEVTGKPPASAPVRGDIRHGFVYERVKSNTSGSIANNAEIEVIWEKWQVKTEDLRRRLNTALKKTWNEWDIPRASETAWSMSAKKLHAEWWDARISRQKEIDASIAAKAEFENLYDRPYEDKRKVRVAGPFTVESLSPHRVLGVDEDDELIDKVSESTDEYSAKQSFPQMILDNLRTAGVQQAQKDGKIEFTSLNPWPGDLVCAEGRYLEGIKERRAAILIGPEFGTVSRPDLVAAAREAGDADFDVLITCAFSYDARSADFDKLGRIPVLKARMNADLHMAEDLKNTGKGNLFVVFGEPDIEILKDGKDKVKVRVKGVDVFKPSTGQVESSGPDDIACWFVDTDYNEESFFVRHAYFLGANDPYSALKATLKAEVDKDAWESLHSDTSRSFQKPKSGRIAVKVINHLGDEVMKVFKVGP
jgi:adenine-specific DNA-methyltransferase